MYDMKTSAVTIRMDTELKRQLNKLCKQTGRSQSEIVRDALKRQFAIIRFRQMRRKILPLAEREDILRTRMCSETFREGVPRHERFSQHFRHARVVQRALRVCSE